MSTIRQSIKDVPQFLDISYLVKFGLILAGFYYFNIFYWGITDPKNYYSPFLDHNLNYISWFNTSILIVAQLIDHIFNLNTLITGNKIYVPDGAGVFLSFDCLGFGVTGFWIAFVVANKNSWKKKLLWSLSGVLIIWFINCWRIAILMLALQHKWPGNKYMDHHGMFNIVSYLLIFLLMYIYIREEKKETNNEIVKSKRPLKMVTVSDE